MHRDILFSIFKQLTLSTLFVCCYVSRRWYGLIKECKIIGLLPNFKLQCRDFTAYPSLLIWSNSVGLTLEVWSFATAAMHGQLPCLQWLEQKMCLRSQLLLTFAAKYGHLHIVQHYSVDKDLKAHVMTIAEKYSHSHILEWLKSSTLNVS